MYARTSKLRAAIIRKTLFARHGKESAVRDILESLSDADLIAMDERERRKGAEYARGKRLARLYKRAC